jgi:hypothetical protein
MNVEPPTKAQNLRQALNRFDPEQPLRSREELEHFSVERSQRTLLKEVHANKAINNDEAHRALLHNLSMLQYRNDDVWYDVHPIVVPLIDTDEATAETDA